MLRALVMLLLLAGCKQSVGGYCCTESCGSAPMTPCGEGLRCDNGGDQGEAHVCVQDVPTCGDPGSACSDPMFPLCGDSGLCEGCTAMEHCSTFPDQPFCGADGDCVACRGEGVESPDCSDPAAPICADKACRECQAGSECGSGICSDGACIAVEQVAFVVAGETGACTQADPCGELFDGVAAHKPYVHVAPGTYVKPVVINETSGASLVVIAEPGAVLKPSLASTALRVATADVAGHAVTIRGLTITETPRSSGSGGIGVVCSDGGATSLTLDQVTLAANVFTGVQSDCALTIDRSIIRDNLGGGVNVTGGKVRLTNSVITGNVGNGFGGVVLGVNVDPASLLAFLTVSNNTAIGATATDGLRCDGVATVHSSIIYGNDSLDLSGICAVTYSDTRVVTPGTGNLSDDPVLDADFRINAASPAANKGKPASGIDHDADGLPRSPDMPDMGAYEVQ